MVSRALFFVSTFDMLCEYCGGAIYAVAGTRAGCAARAEVEDELVSRLCVLSGLDISLECCAVV